MAMAAFAVKQRAATALCFQSFVCGLAGVRYIIPETSEHSLPDCLLLGALLRLDHFLSFERSPSIFSTNQGCCLVEKGSILLFAKFERVLWIF